MKQAPDEFRFNTKLDQTILLGKKARNLAELLGGLRTAPDASIYFHTHKFLQQHHYLSPEPPNDFGYWVTNILNEDGTRTVTDFVVVLPLESVAL